jgi:hypothetical protein
MIPGIVAAPLIASAQGMNAVASPASVSKAQGTHVGTPQTLTTPSTTVAITGGTAPYTHSWITDDPTVSASAPTSATTAFSATLNPGDDAVATCTDTITDANGVQTTAECIASLQLVDFR